MNTEESRTYNPERNGYDVIGSCTECGSRIKYFVDEDGTPRDYVSVYDEYKEATDAARATVPAADDRLREAAQRVVAAKPVRWNDRPADSFIEAVGVLRTTLDAARATVPAAEPDPDPWIVVTDDCEACGALVGAEHAANCADVEAVPAAEPIDMPAPRGFNESGEHFVQTVPAADEENKDAT
jgi:hypothetical protein